MRRTRPLHQRRATSMSKILCQLLLIRTGCHVSREVFLGVGRAMVARCSCWPKTPKNGSLYAITVTCNLHVHRGKRCNKSLTLGACFSEEEALWRIKAWCVAGLGLPDGDHARQRHMDPAFFNPRTVATGELQSLEEMSALVNA